MGESRKSCPVEVYGQRVVGCAQGVNAHVELPAPEQERVEEVPLADIGLGRVVSVERFPPRNVPDFAEDEDPLSLALGGLCNTIGTGFMIHRALLSF